MADSGDNRDNGMSGKKRKTISEQEKKVIKAQANMLDIEISCAVHLLSKLTLGDDSKYLWRDPKFRGIREKIAVINSQPEIYGPVLGDNVPDHSTASVGEVNTASNEQQRLCSALTSNYISDIAMGKDISDGAESSPVLQVVASPTMEFEESSTESHVHVTSLRLCDGSKDQVLGRLSMHLAHDGRRLGAGEIIRLNSFTPIRYTPSKEEGSPHRSPAVVIHTYTRLGYSPVPRDLKDPIHCPTMTREEIEQYSLNSLQFPPDASGERPGFEKIGDKPKCTPEKRCCSLYGVSMVSCVCETDPVDKLDLEVVREYCYFATKTVDKMDNGLKRNMLYWWYMTNIYHICGKGKRKPLPSCLAYAIRNQYKSDDGWYKVFVPSK